MESPNRFYAEPEEDAADRSVDGVLLSETSAALVRDACPLGALLMDLGVRRLKDLDRPERIFRLSAAGLPAKFPPLRAVPGGAAAATQTLPCDLAWFAGRRQELQGWLRPRRAGW
jgi:hypothetical protein